ncbi:interferon-induced protein 44-like, partial [Clarias magur]
AVLFSSKLFIWIPKSKKKKKMGGSEAKPKNFVYETTPFPKVTQPPPSPELDVPWRIMPWGRKDTLEEKLMNFKLYSPDVKFVRILVVGPVGVGKSSFINSINNAFQKRITSGALAANGATISFTKTYKTHHIRGKDGSPLPFVFNDIMGLECENNGGARVEDIISALNGFLEEDYKFNPINPASKTDTNYKSDPRVSDQTFCLVNVISANKVSLMSLDFIQKMKEIREKASALHLPQIIIMTKVDEICPLVKKDIRKVYTSKKIRDK